MTFLNKYLIGFSILYIDQVRLSSQLSHHLNIIMIVY